MAELNTLGAKIAKFTAPYEDAQTYVLSRSVHTAPTAPPTTARYIVPSDATGPWLNRGNQIAYRSGSPIAWRFVMPTEGMTTWVRDESIPIIFNGTEWQNLGGSNVPGGGGKLTLLNKRMPGRATTPNLNFERACDVALAATPLQGSQVQLVLNNLVISSVGDNTRLGCAAYWSADGGFTPRRLNAVQAGDVIYWNSVLAGYPIDSSDVFDFIYEIG